MAARRKKSTKLVLAPLPDYVEKSPVLARKKVGGRGLTKYQESMLLLFTPELMPAFFRTLYTQVRNGDKDAMSLVAGMYGFVQKAGGINIIQQNLNGAAAGGSRYQFDRVVRELGRQQAIETTATEA